MIIRPYSNGDERQIIDLYNLVFKNNRDIEDWHWEFKNNPSGQAIIYVAEDRGRILSHLSGLPFRLKIREEVFTIYSIYDLMVHPDCRCRGIGGELGKVFVDLLETRIRFACVNTQGLAMAMKLGFFDLGPIPRYARVIGYQELKLLLARIKVLRKAFNGQPRGVDIINIDIFGEEFDEFWQRTFRNCCVAVVRDKIFLNWRYVQKPKSRYEKFLIKSEGKIAGYFILEMRKKMGIIVDIVLDRQIDVARNTFEFILDYLGTKGIKYIYIFGPDDYLGSMLKEYGFVIKGFSDCHLVVKLPIDSMISRAVYSMENWLINYGDVESL